MSDQVVKEVGQKDKTGTIQRPYTKIGASFEDVTDDRYGKTSYRLSDFFDNYINFMNENQFIYRGTEKPKNSHVAIWIDTTPNQ